MHKLSSIRLLLALLLTFTVFGASSAERAGDGKDNPLLSRMPGYGILEKTVKEFDAVALQDFEVKGKVAGAKFR